MSRYPSEHEIFQAKQTTIECVLVFLRINVGSLMNTRFVQSSVLYIAMWFVCHRRVWNNGDGRMRLYTVGSGVAVRRPREQKGEKAPDTEEEEEVSDKDFSRYSRMPLF